jgi:D-arabinose 1-dehydrogenase-like Zn-dependent alcohol dehydrogenase
LTFAARHSIKPWIVEFPMNVSGLTRALDALKDGKIRYRAVLSRELAAGGDLDS